MPDPIVAAPAPKPVTPTAPKNGVPHGAPQAPSAPLEVKPAAPATPDPRLAELEKQTKLQAKRAQELATRQKEIETKSANLERERTEYESWKKMREDRRRNPGKYLKEDFGDKWYDTLTKYQLEGAPTGDMITSELDDREAKIAKSVEEKTAALKKELDEIRSRDAQRQQQEFEAGVVSQVKASAEKFPLVNEFAEHASVLQEIRNHFKATTKRGPDGEWVRGVVLTADEAAAKVEARIADVASKFEKYFEAKKAKQPAPTPTQSSTAVVAQRNETPQRRALNNAITASSTPTRTPPRDERERMKAAMAAWDAAEKR